MASDMAQREQEIFAGALELEPSARPVYLEAVCAGDSALHARIEALLVRHESAGSILDRTGAAELLRAMGSGAGRTVVSGTGRGRRGAWALVIGLVVVLGAVFVGVLAGVW